MEEKELREFSWTNLFVVTGVCFLMFSGLLKLLEGSHIQLFFKIGVASSILGVLALLNKWVSPRLYEEKEKPGQKQESLL